MTMSQPLHVLLVEDSQDDARLLLYELERAGFQTAGKRVETEREFLSSLDSGPDVILADCHLPEFDALSALQLVRERGTDVPVIVVTGTLGDEAAVECLKKGAADYLVKDRLARLGQAVTHALAQKRDRDERKQAELALARRAHELARSNIELEQFAYVASHDLQEPLRMVSSFTQLLAQRYTGRLDAQADEFLSYIVDGATRMHTLINDLLEYSRVGTRSEAYQPIECQNVVEHALANLRKAIDETHAVIIHESLPSLSADRTQMVQLFQNLIANAIKYRRDVPLRVHISASRQGPEWVFSVCDNGIGFESKHAERIFIIFQRLHTREAYPGTGIGLAICKKIVERHGGRIWAESEPGVGSRFIFTIPARVDGEP